ncbi:hypothetical protein [Nonlabens antarcticus]|uniref:hypothetical protein n=1 Tax=Nonlabens antarcticus TaxID=392714 RepID=UPI001891AEE6|nr:hypothetical protein [Nonlabens antarcticus]
MIRSTFLIQQALIKRLLRFRLLGFMLLLIFSGCKKEQSDQRQSEKQNKNKSAIEPQFEKGQIKPILLLEEDSYVKIIDSLLELYSNPISQVQLVEVSCNNINDDFLSIYKKDQLVRNEGIGDMQTVDRENLQFFVSLTEQCGFPKNQLRDFRGYLGIFLVLQHSDAKWIAHYYDDFKSIIANGKLPKNFLALLQDRFLLLNNQPQIYGTQIKNGRLYKMFDPKNVYQRRRQMGFQESLRVYLSRQGLKIEEEMERVTSEA